jgi:hypothetical protein
MVSAVKTRWTEEEVNEFRGLVHSLIMVVNGAGFAIVNQDPAKACLGCKDAHELLHRMEEQGFVHKEDK